MKHIVFILGVFYPNSTANGYCTKKIIDELKMKYKVTVIYLNSDNTKSYIVDKGIDLYALNNWRNKIRNFATEKHRKSQNRLGQGLYKLIINLTRILRVIISMTSWPTSEKWFIKKALKRLDNLNEIHNIDGIVTVSIPYEAHIVGLKYKRKHNKIKWLTYTLDQFSDHIAIHRYVINKVRRNQLNIISESEVNNEADFNFITESRRKWCESIPGLNMEKVHELSFPLMAPLQPSNETPFQKRTNEIHLLYAGTFYKDIRNPKYLLELFTNIENENLVLHLFSKGNCEDIINKYVKISSGRIINHGAVRVEQVHSALKQADILVNVGNSVEEQLPSKIYEYISAGKPIINLYRNNLSYQSIFKDYPKVLQINEENPNENENRELFLDFCLTNKGAVIDYNKLEQIYIKSTPKYIAGVFDYYINK